MKNKNVFKLISVFLIAICLSFGVVSVPQITEPVTVMAAETKNMCVGDELFYNNSSYTYKSSNTKVLTVDKTGKMTAVGVGTSKFTLTSGGYSWEYNVNVTYLGSKSKDTKLKKLTKKITKGCKTDFEKVKAVHDWLVLNTKYDIENTSREASHTANGAINKGLAVCEGYAKAFMCMMNILNIPCKIVTGDAGGSHAWNVVKLGKKWYQIDVTWDDPIPDRKNEIGYNYFLLTDKQLSKDHSWIKSDYPKCNTKSDKYIYKMYNVCKNADDVKAELQNQMNKGNSNYQILVKNSSGLTFNDIANCLHELGKYSFSYSFPIERDAYTIYTFY